HHNEDQYQGTCPCTSGRWITCTRCRRVDQLTVDEDRQGCHPFGERVPVRRCDITGGHQNGAVSPATRAMAKVTPEAIPDIAVGKTTFMMVRHFRTPRA